MRALRQPALAEARADNAAPAVTGLAQNEFAATYSADNGTVTVWDDVQGGSGGCRLLASRRLDRWLEVARELAECHQIQCEDACRGCLFVPGRMCAEGNANLDRNTALALLP